MRAGSDHIIHIFLSLSNSGLWLITCHYDKVISLHRVSLTWMIQPMKWHETLFLQRKLTNMGQQWAEFYIRFYFQLWFDWKTFFLTEKIMNLLIFHFCETVPWNDLMITDQHINQIYCSNLFAIALSNSEIKLTNEMTSLFMWTQYTITNVKKIMTTGMITGKKISVLHCRTHILIEQWWGKCGRLSKHGLSCLQALPFPF